MKTKNQVIKIACAALLAAAMPALAQTTQTWNGSVDANWSTAANWSTGTPVAGDSLIFDGSVQTGPNNDLTAGTLIGGINFAPGASPFTLGGNQIWLQGTVQNDATNQLQTIGTPLVLTNTVTFNTVSNDLNLVSGNDIAVTAAVTGPGALVKTGAGTLTLSSASHSGGTTVSQGVLVISNNIGNVTMAGGGLKMNFRTYYTAPTYTFTADSAVGIDLLDNTEPRGIDFAGNMGSPGFKLTKNGLGILRIVGNVNAGSIDVAEGTLASLGGSSMAATHWGTGDITVENGATLRADDGGVCPNNIFLNGGDGTSAGSYQHQGVLVSGSRNNGANPTNNIFTGTVTLNSDSTVGSQYGNMIVSGKITGPGGLTKIGVQPLILSGTNDFGGALIVNAGTLKVGSPKALPSGATNSYVQLANNTTLDLNGTNASANGFIDDGAGLANLDNTAATPATFTFGNNNTSASFFGAVKNSGGGALSLVYVGSGTASFLGVNTYSGSNVVSTSGGTLDINIPTGTTTGGVVAVADGATLSLHYRVAGSSLKASGATFGSSGATTLTVDLNNYGNPTPPVINATNGTGVLSANGTITINFNNMANIVVGQFPIIKYITRTGTGNFVLGSLPGGIVAHIVTNTPNKSIDLQITSSPITTWKGKLTNNLWDTTTTNWTYSGSPVLYTDGSAVLFGDGALTNNVNLTTTLLPSSTLVNSTNNYTFGGAGSLASGDLTKNGTGTLILDTANSYNNTVISAGTIQVGVNDTIGSLGTGTINNGGTLVFNRSDNLTVSSTMSGAGTFVQNNTNILTLSVANAHTGGNIVGQGVLKISDNNALGVSATTTLVTVSNGATLDIGGRLVTSASPQYVVISGSGVAANKGALATTSGMGCTIGCGIVGVRYLRLLGDASIGDSTGDFQIGADVNVAGPNYGSIDGQGFALTKVGNNTLVLEATNASALSRFTILAGGVIYGNGGNNVFGNSCQIVISNNAWLDTWDQKSQAGITFANPITIGVGGGQLRNTRGSYGGNENDNYNGSITLNDTLTTLCTYSKGQMFFNGTISGVGGILNSGGSRPVTLVGAMNYTGPTTVSNLASLQLSANQQGGGAYVSADTATLDVINQSSAPTLPMSALTLGTVSGGTLAFSRVTSFPTVNPIITATNLTLIGTSAVLFPPSVYATPGQYPLIKYTGSISGGGSLSAGGAGTRGTPGYISNNIANSTIYLVVPGGVPVIWTGASGGSTATNWDIASSLNWKTNGVATVYLDNGTAGDAVTFDDSASVTNINITATVKPALINVNNTNKLYTFTGSVISGTGGLLKQGTNTLFLNNGANTFTGGSTINGGTVRLGNDGSLNNSSGTVTVSGNGTLDFNTFNPSTMACTISGSGFNGQGTLIGSVSDQARGPKTITMAGDATIGGSKRWDLRQTGSALLSPTNSYTLTKVGANQISMVGVAVSTNLGDIRILSGTLSFETTTGYGDTNKTIYVGNGGSFAFYQNTIPVTKTMVLSNNASIALSSGNASSQNIIYAPMTLVSGLININGNFNNGVILSNIISGAGGLNVQFNSDVLMSGANTFTGDLNTGGRVKLVGNASLATTNIININNGGSGVLTLQDNTVIGGQQLQVFSGPATGALIVKNGGTVNTKTIWVGNVLADWSGRTDGTLTLQNGQTLRIDNGGRIKGNVVAVSGSTVTPGGSFNIQNTGVCSNNVTCQAGSTTYMDISLNGGVTNNDALTVIGTLTYAGTLQINNMGTNKLTAGNSFKLFTGGTYSGSFASISTNINGQFITWNTSQLPVNGSLIVASATVNNRTNITSVVNGSNVELSWPADHIGWSLQVQTNSLNTGLSSNWVAVPGSTLVNSVTNAINAANGSVFYRLSYP